MATHPSILAWRIPWTEEPDRLQSLGSQTPVDFCPALKFLLSSGSFLFHWKSCVPKSEVRKARFDGSGAPGKKYLD